MTNRATLLEFALAGAQIQLVSKGAEYAGAGYQACKVRPESTLLSEGGTEAMIEHTFRFYGQGPLVEGFRLVNGTRTLYEEQFEKPYRVLLDGTELTVRATVRT